MPFSSRSLATRKMERLRVQRRLQQRKAIDEVQGVLFPESSVDTQVKLLRLSLRYLCNQSMDVNETSHVCSPSSMEHTETRTITLDCILAEEERKFLGKAMFQGLKQFANSEDLSDVDVVVGSETFKCHKVILAAWSPYFRAMFSSGMVEMRQSKVTLSSFEPEGFRGLMTILYQGISNISVEHVEEILYAASYLQIESIEMACQKNMLQNLNDPERTLGFLLTVRSLQLNKTAQKIINHIIKYFSNYANCSDLTKLSYEDIGLILQSEQVAVPEEVLCNSLLSWIEADMKNRQMFATELISKLRYLALSVEHMAELFLEHPLIKENEELEHVRNKCMSYIKCPSDRNKYIGEREAMHREGSDLTDCIVVCQQFGIRCICERTIQHDGSFLVDCFSLPLPHPLTVVSVSVCSFGRSEMCMSDGFHFHRYNGLSNQWNEGPMHTLHQQDYSNCLLHETVTNSIYSIVANSTGIEIEKYTKSGEKWKVVYMKRDRKNGFPKVTATTDLTVSKRTCAYIIDKDIFILDSSSIVGDTAIVKFSTTTSTICFIVHHPVYLTYVAAVTHGSLVFLVDKYCRDVLRVSEKGTCIHHYGQIGHDIPNYATRQNFGICMWRGKLIVLGGCHGNSDLGWFASSNGLEYDLDSHHTVTHHKVILLPFEANVLKLTLKRPDE